MWKRWLTDELLVIGHYFRALLISNSPSFEPNLISSLTKTPLPSLDTTDLCGLTYSAYCCCSLTFIVNCKACPSRWAERGGSNTCQGRQQRERQAYALSLWPGLLASPDNMAEKHIWPKIISSQTAKQTSSQPLPWLKLLAFTSALFSFLSGFALSYFQQSFCDRGGENQWSKRPNLAVEDPRRDAEFIPAVSKYWPVASRLSPWNLGFFVAQRGSWGSLSLLLQHCCISQECQSQQTNINPQTCCFLINCDQMASCICPLFTYEQHVLSLQNVTVVINSSSYFWRFGYF